MGHVGSGAGGKVKDQVFSGPSIDNPAVGHDTERSQHPAHMDGVLHAAVDFARFGMDQNDGNVGGVQRPRTVTTKAGFKAHVFQCRVQIAQRSAPVARQRRLQILGGAKNVKDQLALNVCHVELLAVQPVSSLETGRLVEKARRLGSRHAENVDAKELSVETEGPDGQNDAQNVGALDERVGPEGLLDGFGGWHPHLVGKEVGGGQDQSGPKDKVGRQLHPEKEPRQDASHHHRHGRDDSLDDIVGVFDNGGHEHTAAGTQHHQGPNPFGKAVKVGFGHVRAASAGKHLLQESQDNGEKGQLDVSHPDRNLLRNVFALEDFFKVHPGEGRTKGPDADGNESHGGGFLHERDHGPPDLGTERHNGNTNANNDEAHPLFGRVPSLEQDDADHGHHHQFHLLRNMKDGCGQVGQADIDQTILNKVQQGRDRHP